MNKTLEIQIKNMPAGRQIDEMISEKLFGTKFIKPTHGTCCTCQTCGWNYDDCMCGWSTELEKAWKVLEKMGGAFVVDYSAPELGPDVIIFKGDSQETSKSYKGSADTFELAVCRAALMALLS